MQQKLRYEFKYGFSRWGYVWLQLYGIFMICRTHKICINEFADFNRTKFSVRKWKTLWGRWIA